MAGMDQWAVPYRWNVKAEYANGGKGAVTLAEGASVDDALVEIGDYLRRGATTVVVERYLP